MISLASSQRYGRTAFTLIEILLVLAIIGILSAVVVPSVVRSMGSNQRRMAVRTVVATGRYARSMAVLKQVPVILEFDLASHQVRVGRAGALPVAAEPEPDEFGLSEPPAATNAVLVGVDDVFLERSLAPIELEAVTVERDEEDEVAGERVRVRYDVNGRCTPYRVVLVDREKKRIIVTIDALASSQIEEVGL